MNATRGIGFLSSSSNRVMRSDPKLLELLAAPLSGLKPNSTRAASRLLSTGALSTRRVVMAVSRNAQISLQLHRKLGIIYSFTCFIRISIPLSRQDPRRLGACSSSPSSHSISRAYPLGPGTSVVLQHERMQSSGALASWYMGGRQWRLTLSERLPPLDER